MAANEKLQRDKIHPAIRAGNAANPTRSTKSELDDQNLMILHGKPLLWTFPTWQPLLGNRDTEAVEMDKNLDKRLKVITRKLETIDNHLPSDVRVDRLFQKISNVAQQLSAV
eukprot:TRINITY_DN8471_c0_g1_i1.p1 TRINITY_DN8471_c0_g1~~TRINITY_DN8471_c0_g1_i1.p1  ORF type:complete len:112 (-),score=20.08 TRINITY_DN8471_c0_g1_i1:92-427(-)